MLSRSPTGFPLLWLALFLVPLICGLMLTPPAGLMECVETEDTAVEYPPVEALAPKVRVTLARPRLVHALPERGPTSHRRLSGDPVARPSTPAALAPPPPLRC